MSYRIKFNGIKDVLTFVKYSEKLACDVDMKCRRFVVDGKSVLGLMSLDLTEEVIMFLNTGDASSADAFIALLRKHSFVVNAI